MSFVLLTSDIYSFILDSLCSSAILICVVWDFFISVIITNYNGVFHIIVDLSMGLHQDHLPLLWSSSYSHIIYYLTHCQGQNCLCVCVTHFLMGVGGLASHSCYRTGFYKLGRAKEGEEKEEEKE